MDNLNYLKKLKCCLTPPEPSRSRPVLLGPDPVVWDRILPQWVPVTQVEAQDEERCSSRSILPLQSPHWGFWPPGWLWGWWVSRPWKISKCKLGARAFLPPVSQSVSQSGPHLSHVSGSVLEPGSNVHPHVVSLPVAPHPDDGRLWKGAGLTSLSITKAAGVTSVRLDSSLWWVSS